MPLRQTIGISLALLVASAGAMAKTPEKGSSQQSAKPPDPDHRNSADQFEKTRAPNQLASSGSLSRVAWRGREQPGYWRPAVRYATQSYWPSFHTIGAPEIGQAAWYDLVGGRTADGERLDTVTPTAAHRSLPLGSCAKVTDLDTGRTVIVRINDRGPYHRRFIIDLSPRAAEVLGMRRSGVAAVAVEPVAIEPAAAMPATSAATRPTMAAVYRIAGTNMTQWAP